MHYGAPVRALYGPLRSQPLLGVLARVQDEAAFRYKIWLDDEMHEPRYAYRKVPGGLETAGEVHSETEEESSEAETETEEQNLPVHRRMPLFPPINRIPVPTMKRSRNENNPPISHKRRLYVDLPTRNAARIAEVGNDIVTLDSLK
eukprot:GHVU01018117.1.p1 GENE.GHVU01018117.1~~GHVU01018117.1.p1  ORF type:complete len:146 (+),score=11.99 GHVU01018117.1:854-1291(+)